MTRIALCLAFLFAVPAVARAQSFVRGDANDSGAVDLSDAVFSLGFLFTGGEAPPCADAADTNDDGSMDISDPVAVLNFLFLGAAAPRPPFPECGADPSEDALGCASYTHCTACYGQGDLEATLRDAVEPTVCIPAGSVEPVELSVFLVTACPLELAAGCPAPESAQKGCPVMFAEIRGRLDVPGREVSIHIEGVVPDFPIRIEDSTFGDTTDCRIDIVFSGDVVAPFRLSAGGTPTIEEVLQPVLESPVVEVTTDDTEIICRGLVALQAQFVDQLVEQLESAAGDLLAGVNAELVGKTVCMP